MEILKRAKNKELDIISASESESNVREEVNRRTWKAGLTDRDGQMMTSRNSGAGKGDVFRPVNKQKYDENYDRIFRKNK